MSTKAPGKILYLEGLRGVAAFVVVVFHFISMFDLQALAWIPGTPVNTFVSGSAAVAIFFVLSGFVLSYPYFLKQNKEILISGLFRRYFRLAWPVLVTTMIYCLLMYTHVIDHTILQQVSDATGVTWASEHYQFQPSFVDAFRQSLVGVFIKGSSHYNSVLWTMKRELVGSVIVYVTLLIAGTWRYRPLFYALVFLGYLLRVPINISFVMGIWLCDLFVNHALEKHADKTLLKTLLFLGGVYLLGYPLFEDPAFIAGTMYGWVMSLGYFTFWDQAWLVLCLGAGLMLAFVLLSPRAQRWLSHPACVFLGAISFSLYLIHYAVLFGMTTRLYLALASVMPSAMAAATAFAVSIPVMLAVSWGLVYVADNPSIWLGKWLYGMIRNLVSPEKKEAA